MLHLRMHLGKGYLFGLVGIASQVVKAFLGAVEFGNLIGVILFKLGDRDIENSFRYRERDLLTGRAKLLHPLDAFEQNLCDRPHNCFAMALRARSSQLPVPGTVTNTQPVLHYVGTLFADVFLKASKSILLIASEPQAQRRYQGRFKPPTKP